MTFRSKLSAAAEFLLGFFRPSKELEQLRKRLDELRSQVDLLKSKLEIPPERWFELQELRRSQRTLPAEPLVSICVTTYNRANLLTRRCLPSLLNQTYRNLEVIVVSDGSTDDTAAAVAALGDARIRFLAIERAPPPLDEPLRRWMVYGTDAINRALSLAGGDLITHLDDDDEHDPDRLAKLIPFVREHDADLVYHPFMSEQPNGRWKLNPAERLDVGHVTTSVLFCRNWLKHVPWDWNAHLLGEPGDWNRVRRIQYLGAKCVRYPEPLLKHYRERTQHPPQPA